MLIPQPKSQASFMHQALPRRQLPAVVMEMIAREVLMTHLSTLFTAYEDAVCNIPRFQVAFENVRRLELRQQELDLIRDKPQEALREIGE